MKFNYGLEKKKFDARWARLEVEYKEAGMTEEAIRSMWEYDWDGFKRERNHRNKVMLYEPEITFNSEGDEIIDPIVHKYIEDFSVDYEDNTDEKDWFNNLSNIKLIKGVKMLNETDIEILDLFAIKEYTLTEIAAIKGISHQAISKKIKRIKKFLREKLES